MLLAEHAAADGEHVFLQPARARQVALRAHRLGEVVHVRQRRRILVAERRSAERQRALEAFARSAVQRGAVLKPRTDPVEQPRQIAHVAPAVGKQPVELRDMRLQRAEARPVLGQFRIVPARRRQHPLEHRRVVRRDAEPVPRHLLRQAVQPQRGLGAVVRHARHAVERGDVLAVGERVVAQLGDRLVPRQRVARRGAQRVGQHVLRLEEEALGQRLGRGPGAQAQQLRGGGPQALEGEREGRGDAALVAAGCAPRSSSDAAAEANSSR